MKISINDIRLAPKEMGFNFCVFGEPSEEIKKWSENYGFRLEESDRFTNIIIPKAFDISNCFEKRTPFKYVDGFSPNLNKNLHIGHLSNLIIAKSLQSLNIGDEFISILGDTLKGEVSKEDALYAFNQYCAQFKFDVSKTYMASEMKYDGDFLIDGEGDYEGTKIFDLGGDDKVVGIKSDGSTTYFYQDVALGSLLKDSTLYLTGKEQENHFRMLKKIFSDIDHIGLGLVTISGEKMSSRKGNVIYASDVIKFLMSEFNNDIKIVYNVLAGQILKSAPGVNKKIDMDTISNVKTSPGLYLSYTMARLRSAGINIEDTDKFNSNEIEFKFLKAKYNLSPHILLEELISHCQNINGLYEKHTIKSNDRNRIMFEALMEDLVLGAKQLGFFIVDKV